MSDKDTCPVCGRRVLGVRPTPGEELCTPASCDAWIIDAKFNHETREWESL